MMTLIQLLKEQVKTARETFDGTMADVTESQLHTDPGGKALPLAAAYAHLILSEDLTVQRFIQGKVPLYESTFNGKTGLSALMPPMDENWEKAHLEWAKSAHMDRASFDAYTKAVYAQTDAYLESITDEDLEKEVDLGAWGKKTIAYLIHAFLIAHMNSLAGEVSAVKGVFGAKGYQF